FLNVFSNTIDSIRVQNRMKKILTVVILEKSLQF
ncbi:hypothetical protein LEP1GSC165_2556, partial [Leptospira santarosai str. CBC523]